MGRQPDGFDRSFSLSCATVGGKRGRASAAEARSSRVEVKVSLCISHCSADLLKPLKAIFREKILKNRIANAKPYF